MASKFMETYGYDMILGSIAAFYVFMAPYTKVEESFNVQAMHDILYHGHHIENYDHLEFPGVVPRTFIGSLLVSSLASPLVFVMTLLQLPKIYGLLAVRLALGCIILFTLRFFRVQLLVQRCHLSWHYMDLLIVLSTTFSLGSLLVALEYDNSFILLTSVLIRDKFGHQVEAFFVIFVSIQFHMLFYCTRPLPNIMALGLVNMAYGYWFKGCFYAALNCLIFATVVFRCDILLLLGPLGLELLLTKSISFWKAFRYCIGAALFSIGLTVLVDSFIWRKPLWPEFEVFWFNSVLNRSSEWGTHSFHWYFSSALPRSLLAAYPLFALGVLLERRLLFYILPVFSFILLYSKLPHKELRFIISSIPIFNLSAAVAASRIYNNRKKNIWNLFFIAMLGLLIISLGGTITTFMASHENYPGGNALKELHKRGYVTNSTDEVWVHIDTFSAMNGVSRFCENGFPWRYSKEEEIPVEEYRHKNFTYLLNEHRDIKGFKCLFTVNGFSHLRLQTGFPQVSLVKEPKVHILGSITNKYVNSENWPGCLGVDQ